MSGRHRGDRERTEKNDRNNRRNNFRNAHRANSEETMDETHNNESLEQNSTSSSSNSIEPEPIPTKHNTRSSGTKYYNRQNHYSSSSSGMCGHGRTRATARITASSDNTNLCRESTGHGSSELRGESRSNIRNIDESEIRNDRRTNIRNDERMDYRSSGGRGNNRARSQNNENYEAQVEILNVTMEESSPEDDRMEQIGDSFSLSRREDISDSRNENIRNENIKNENIKNENSRIVFRSDKKSKISPTFEITLKQEATSSTKLINEVGNKPVPSSTDVLNAFECPVCMEYMVPPLYQCSSGHLVCDSCRPKLSCCPSCRGPVPSVRNLAMEKIAATIFFPCKYSGNGCPDALSATEKLPHEEGCEYRPYCCPCPGASCRWQGNVEQVMPHLMKAHRSITTLQGEDIVFLATDISLPGAVDWVMLQSCYGCHFMLVLEKQEKYGTVEQFYAIVQLIGSKKEAEQFIYRLELSNQKRRLCWEAAPRSIHEGIATSLSMSDCLLFDSKLARLFSENGNLGINVTITKV
uniref:E3 ubiquitin-protein ligase n=1 Tax=Parastrongyloides trichosuri TaxID=131310 RepID=A0A0N4ZBB6_PARTI